MAIYPSLADMPVLITGGASGIGAATVRAFARQKARVAFIDRDAEAAARTCDMVREENGREVLHGISDLTDIDATSAVVRELAGRTGVFRTLLNNAGNDAFHAFNEVTPAYFDDRIAVNLRHQFFLAQAVASEMAGAGGGSIINFGSICWMVGAVNVPVYAAAKAAIEGLTRSLARELGPANIRVNSIAPGWVLTERQLAKGRDDPAKFDAYLARQCLKRHLEPDDVAELALWLAAEESRNCTAHTWFVDAGAAAG